MKTSGTAVVNRPVGDTPGICLEKRELDSGVVDGTRRHLASLRAEVAREDRATLANNAESIEYYLAKKRLLSDLRVVYVCFLRHPY